MSRLTFGYNITLDDCVDHEEGVADDETHAYFTRMLDDCGALLWGRTTHEMMEPATSAQPCGSSSPSIRPACWSAAARSRRRWTDST
ncbi:MAG: hypothetical protein RIT45_2199 [Pseudomonadota bacterium]|jgi:hypothetical protein